MKLAELTTPYPIDNREMSETEVAQNAGLEWMIVIFGVLAIAGLGVAGYFIWKKKQQSL